MNARQALLSAPILPTIWRLSVPNLFAMVATALVSVAETSYVGLLGTPALAGMALVFPLAMLQQMLSAGSMGGGISSAISRALGAGDEPRAQALALHALIISAVLGLVLGLAVLLGGEALFALMGGAGEALQQAQAYAGTLFAGALMVWLTNALASVVRGSGDMRTPSVVLLGVSVLQIVLGGSLGLGLGPMPRLGMQGIALGQVLAFALGGLVLTAWLCSSRARLRLRLRGLGPLRRELFADILRVGAVASISSFQTVLTIMILTRLVARFGTDALAGYGIGTRLEFMVIPVTFAIGVACVPMVGMAMGAGLVARARRVAWTGACMAALIVGVAGLLAALWPLGWAGWFSTQAGVLAAASSYLHWVGPVYAFFGFGLCLYFASQGSGKLLGPVLAGTIRLLVVLVGGLLIQASAASAQALFMLISGAMLLYGLLTAWFVHLSRWERP